MWILYLNINRWHIFEKKKEEWRFSFCWWLTTLCYSAVRVYNLTKKAWQGQIWSYCSAVLLILSYFVCRVIRICAFVVFSLFSISISEVFQPAVGSSGLSRQCGMTEINISPLKALLKMEKQSSLLKTP